MEDAHQALTEEPNRSLLKVQLLQKFDNFMSVRPHPHRNTERNNETRTPSNQKGIKRKPPVVQSSQKLPILYPSSPSPNMGKNDDNHAPTTQRGIKQRNLTISSSHFPLAKMGRTDERRPPPAQKRSTQKLSKYAHYAD